MSHVISEDARAEPNLVPLLDLVFQLIMFFMITVNFVSAQLNEEIKLPIAQSARAMDKAEVEVLVLNMDAGGKLARARQAQPVELADHRVPGDAELARDLAARHPGVEAALHRIDTVGVPALPWCRHGRWPSHREAPRSAAWC